MKKVDLRALANAKKKIDSPLAKYNSVGQLYCVLCNTHVKNEMLWTGHVNGKAHREALTNLKAAGAGATVATSAASTGKRPAPAATAPNPAPRASEHEFVQPPPVKKPALELDPSSTFKIPSTPPPKHSTNSAQFSLILEKNGHEHDDDEDEEEAMEEDEVDDNAEVEEAKQPESSAPTQPAAAQLPAGFFDDPKEDAKARGLEWRDPEEVEWERFVKEIAGEEVVSSSLRTMDDEESTKSRELEEIEEQMAHWQKVVDLERKVEAVRQEQQKQREAGASSRATGDDSDEDEDLEYDEDLDWRAKRH